MADRAPWQAAAGAGPAANTDVIDRAARQLGVADVSDRVGRALGAVSIAGGALDVSDRAARQLGQVAGVADQAVQGAVSLVGDTVTAAVRPGDATWGAAFPMAGGGTHAFEVSYDGGANFRPAPLVRGDNLNNGGQITGAGNGAWYEGAIPPSATHVRTRCTAAPGAPPVTMIVATSRSSYEPLVAISGTPTVDVNDRAARALGAITAAAGATFDVADRAARLAGRVSQGVADSAAASGNVVGPAAGAAIATLAAASLPAGVYDVLVELACSADLRNMEIRKGAAVQFGGPLVHSVNTVTVHHFRMTFDGATALSVNATNAAASTYAATIIATRIE